MCHDGCEAVGRTCCITYWPRASYYGPTGRFVTWIKKKWSVNFASIHRAIHQSWAMANSSESWQLVCTPDDKLEHIGGSGSPIFFKLIWDRIQIDTVHSYHAHLIKPEWETCTGNIVLLLFQLSSPPRIQNTIFDYTYVTSTYGCTPTTIDQISPFKALSPLKTI